MCACYLYLADRLKSSYRVVLNYTEFENDLSKKCVIQVSVLMEVEGQVLMAVMGYSGYLNVVLWSFAARIITYSFTTTLLYLMHAFLDDLFFFFLLMTLIPESMLLLQWLIPMNPPQLPLTVSSNYWDGGYKNVTILSGPPLI